MIACEEASDWRTVNGSGQNCGAGSGDAEELQDNLAGSGLSALTAKRGQANVSPAPRAGPFFQRRSPILLGAPLTLVSSIDRTRMDYGVWSTEIITLIEFSDFGLS